MGHFTEEGLRQIQKRKQVLPPKSLTSGLWEVLAQWVMILLPQWMAPSFIAFIGLSIIFSGYGVFMMFPIYQRWLLPQGVLGHDTEWEFKNYEFIVVPGIFYLNAAVSTFVYLVLKAAVRIRAQEGSQPSALVEIIDHSCDAVSITLVTLTLAAALRLGVSTETVVLFCSMHVEYYLTNWEHNQKGILSGEGMDTTSHSFKLSVNEGLLVCIAAYFGSLIDSFFWRTDVGQYVPGAFPECPPDITSKTSDGCFRLNQLLVYIFAAVVAVHVVLRILPVRAHFLEFENHEELLMAAYKQLLPLASACTATILWASCSPTELFKRRPHIFFLGIGVVLGNVNIRLMTANLSKQKFSCYPYTLLLLCLSTFISVCGGYGIDYDRDGPSEDLCLLWFFFNSVPNGIKLVNNIAYELCKATHASLISTALHTKRSKLLEHASFQH